MSEETVSFYQIAKELAEEEQISVEVYDPEREIIKNIRLVVDGKVQDQSKFNTYRKKRQEYIEAFFPNVRALEKCRVVKVNEEKNKKEIEFRIPKTQKECVKFLLCQHTSAVSRKIRKDKTRG